MPQQKYGWKSIGIPAPMYEQIKSIIAFAGFLSVSEYVREAVRRRLDIDLVKFEEFNEHLEELREKKKEMIE